MTEPAHRITYLDSTRGLAALVVLLAHFQLAIIPEWSINPTIQFTPLRLLFQADAAVLYFFILSGYVLTRSVKTSKLNFRSYFNFAIKRVCRIYPAFIIAFILMFFTLQFIDSVSNEWLKKFWVDRNFTVVSLFKQLILVLRYPNEPELRLLPHDWTLSIEMGVSLILPFLAIGGRVNPHIMLLLVFVAIKFFHLDPFVFDFSLGVYLASLKWDLTLKRWQRLLLLLGSFIFLYAGDLYYPMKRMDLILIHHQSAGLFMLLIIVLSTGRLQKFLSIKPLQFLGKISYSFYLLHLGILLILTEVIPGLNGFLFFLIYLSLTLLLSAINYQIVEKPYIRLGRKLSE